MVLDGVPFDQAREAPVAAFEEAVARLAAAGGSMAHAAPTSAPPAGLAEGTVLAVTHDRWFARSFDRFLVFGSDGAVREAPEPVWHEARVQRTRCRPKSCARRSGSPTTRRPRR